MAKGTNKITIQVDGKGIQGTKKQLDGVAGSQRKVTRGNKKLTNSSVAADRGLKGTANMSSNVSKNFSKMQQGLEGGGGSGGLVRAYALLAANVFALTAAFGILSRGAQVDTLIQSMERLEVVSGKSIKTIARDLQEASGFGMDFAASLRSTSLALSAGFESKQISELGAVARNAAVSLGRNVPDALDRIFRGVIKVEPELLDEIGLFVRVNEAAAKYASQLGVAVGDLTEFQKRQAFANEAIQQGQDKFQAFEDIQIDPFAQLATTFSDMTQGILTFINNGLKPLITLFSNNKVLFGQVFLLIGMQLVKMIIPAIGQFTLGIAANADAARSAALESAQQTKVKILALQQEQQELKLNNIEKQKSIALDSRFKGTPAKLQVRGKDKSSKLETALLKENVIGANRLLIVDQRITDLKTAKGLAQRMNNAATKEELRLLELESLELHEQLRLESQISNIKSIEPDKGSFTDLSSKRDQKAILKADALAFTTATAEMKGTKEGFKALNSQIQLASDKAKAAGVSFGFMDKTMLKMSGTAAILGVKLQKTMMVLGPYITLLMIAIPVVTMLSKLFGFFGKEQSALKTANDEATEGFKTLNKQLEHAREQFEKFQKDDNFGSMNDSILAMKESIVGAATALEKQSKALEDYRDNTYIIVQQINAAFSDMFGKTAEEKIEKNTKALIESIKNASGQLTDEMLALEKQFKRRSKAESFFNFFTEVVGVRFDMTGEIEKDILKLAKTELEAYKTIKSAIDGAKDSAREFRDSLIVKTDVDKPLATFRQITSSIRNSVLTQKEQANLLKEINTEEAIRTLLTKDQIIKFENINKELVKSKDGSKAQKKLISENLVLLDAMETSYARQQELLIQQKSELLQIKSIQDQIKSLRKFSVTAIDMEVRLTQRKKDLEYEALQNDFQRKVTATGLTEERVRELSQLNTIVDREKELGLTLEQSSMVHTAIASMRQVQVMEAEEEMRLATLELNIQNDKVKAALLFMQVEQKYNKMLSSRVKTLQTIERFGSTGTTTLTAGDELDIANEQERIRNKNLEERMNAEISVAQFQFKLASIELDVIKARTEATAADELRINREASILLAKTDYGSKENIRLKGIMAESGKAYEEALGIVGDIDKTQEDLAKASKSTAATIVGTYAGETEKFIGQIAGIVSKTFKDANIGSGFDNLLNNLTAGEGIEQLLELDPDKFSRQALQIRLMETALVQFGEKAKELFGEQGVLPAALADFSAGLLATTRQLGESFKFIEEKMKDSISTDYSEVVAAQVATIGEAISASLSGLSSAFSAFMQNNITEVENLIKAEQNRDGKSQESLQKLKQLEAQKEKLKKKEFETNKKIMLAQAVISTAAGVAGALALTAVLGPVGAGILAGVIGAMGAAQVALISKMKYTGGSAADSAAPMTALSIGSRSSNVDVAQNATGGELNYLRGGNTSGTNLGGAGGAMGRKGYANGGEGIVVGERGPEVITPASPVDITPNFALGGGTTNVNFSINAVDATGVEDLLVNQRGNIIRMIREAANENGEDFLTQVDPMAYGSNS
jgi:hypothetical protein